MYRLLLVVFSVALTSCVSKQVDDEKLTHTGTIKYNEEEPKLQLKDATTIGELINALPQMDDKTCKDFLSELTEQGIEIVSTADKEIVFLVLDNKSITYVFESGGCV